MKIRAPPKPEKPRTTPLTRATPTTNQTSGSAAAAARAAKKGPSGKLGSGVFAAGSGGAGAGSISNHHDSVRDSHHRHRPRPAQHGLGHHRGRRLAPRLRRLRIAALERRPAARRAAARIARRAHRRHRPLPAGRGGGRGDVRQSRSAIGAETRPGARHRPRRAGARRPGDLRICCQSGEEDGGRNRPCAEGPGRHDGRRAAAEMHGPDADAADALAVAITHAQHRGARR